MALLRPRHHHLTRRELLAAFAAMPACARATEAAPWSPAPRPLSAGFHRGMNLAHLHRRGLGYGSDRAAAQLDALRALGVSHLALNPFAYLRRETGAYGGHADRYVPEDAARGVLRAWFP